MTKPKKGVPRTHPWRAWIPKADKPLYEPTKKERVPVGSRMGVRL